MKRLIDNIRNILKPLTKLFIAFISSAILFQVIADVKLLNIDILGNISKIIDGIGNDTTMGLIAIIILLNVLGKKVNIY